MGRLRWTSALLLFTTIAFKHVYTQDSVDRCTFSPDTGIKMTGKCIDAEVGYKCVVTCEEDYYLMMAGYKERPGTKEIVCQEGGSWDLLPYCQKIVCPVPVLQYGLTTGDDCQSAMVGEKCGVKCQKGFQLMNGLNRIMENEKAITCTEEGAWDLVPTCAVDRCADQKESQMTWTDFCGQVLKRRCLYVPGKDPECTDCLPGFAEAGSTVCVAHKGCDEQKEDGKSWKDFCAESKMECDATGPEPACKDCRNGQKLNPGTLRCDWQQDCWTEKEHNVRWRDFCALTENECEEPNETGEWWPLCRQCRTGETLNHGTLRCDNRTTCQSQKDGIQKWRQFCGSRGQECQDPTQVSQKEPTCKDCPAGILLNPLTFRCDMKVRKTCWDMKDPSLRWVEFCAQTDQKCEETYVDGQWWPLCKDCPEGQRLLPVSFVCNRYTCNSIKESTISWSDFCSQEDNRRCVEEVSGPKCACRAGCKEGEGGKCQCGTMKLKIQGTLYVEVEEEQGLDLIRLLSAKNATRIELS